MDRYEEEAEDSDNETDPEQLLNEWLGELDSLTVVSLYFFLCGLLTVHLTIEKPHAANAWTAELVFLRNKCTIFFAIVSSTEERPRKENIFV